MDEISYSNYHKKYIRRIWYTYAICIIAAPLFILAIRVNFLNLFGSLPSLYTLENPKTDFSSELYSADRVLLGKYFRYNRSPVEYEEISSNVIKALKCTEDYRFEKHSGVDFYGLFRVFLLSILLQKNKGGGSTISQQLAKNLFKTRSNEQNGLLSNLPIIGTILLKVKEWIVAVQLERAYTKQEIIAMYLNTVSFGSNAFGIKVASKVFFNTTQDLLTIPQAALLIGILRAPSYYSPIKHPKLALSRRNTVLLQLYKYKNINQNEYKSFIKLPLGLEYRLEDQNIGLATYFRSVVRDFLLKWAQKKGYDLFEDGLKIYTTIDSRLQYYAEEAVKEHMKELQKSFMEHWGDSNPWVDENGNEIEDFIEKATKNSPLYQKLLKTFGNDINKINEIMNTPVLTKIFTWDGEKEVLMTPIEEIKYNKKMLHVGFMAMEPNTGHIKAWVGGINHKYFKYDHVMQSKRQPGSAFKPIVYAAAIDNGYMPWHTLVDAPITFADQYGYTWTPQNWSKKYTGQKMTLRQALAKSVNSITAYLTKQLGPEVIVSYAQRLGITSPINPTPSLCLGSYDVSVYELAGAYSTFMNKGVWIQPFYITHIEDKNGRIIEEFIPQKREAINENTAYLMIHMLKGSIEEIDSISNVPYAIKCDNELGVKTGTTSNQSDGWFVSLSNGLCTCTWVGADNRCVHFKDLLHGSGAKVAKPLWNRFILKVYNDERLPYKKGPIVNYPKPLGLVIPESKFTTILDCIPDDEQEQEDKTIDLITEDE